MLIYPANSESFISQPQNFLLAVVEQMRSESNPARQRETMLNVTTLSLGSSEITCELLLHRK